MKRARLDIVCGVIALTLLGWTTISGASSTLEICGFVPGPPCPAPTPPVAGPPVPPAFPGPSGSMTINASEPSLLPQIPLGTPGYVSNYLYLSDPGRPAGATDLVSFQLLGHGDASSNNTFQVFALTPGVGAPLINWTVLGTPGLTQQTVALPANQLLPFWFGSAASNDGSHNLYGFTPNFFLTLGSVQTFGGSSALIGLSDGGAAAAPGFAGPAVAPACTGAADCDYQDMVIAVRLVPEPATFLLLGVGLAGIGVAGWRRKLR